MSFGDWYHVEEAGPQRIDEPWQQKLEELEMFNQQTVEALGLDSSRRVPGAKARVTFLKQDSPASEEDLRWSRGTNSNNNSRTFRALMPYWLFEHIFHNVDLDHFTQHGGVGCNLWELDYLKYVYHIRGGQLSHMDWKIVGGPFVEVKAIELCLNYMTQMIRYQIY